jgi:autotransporter-associated beta strand protein
LTLFGTTINGNTGTGIEIDAGAGPITVNAPLVLQNNQQWTNSSASPLTVNGAISGNGSLTKIGSGILALTGADTYTGPTILGGGTLALNAQNVIQTSSSITITNATVQTGYYNPFGYAGGVPPIAINAGGLLTQTAADNVNLGAVTLNGGTLSSNGLFDSFYGSYYLQQNFSVTGSATSTISALAITSAGPRTFAVAAGSTLNVTGYFSNLYGDFGLIEAGGGTMILTGANTYTGATTISGGTLQIGGAGVLGGGNYNGAISNNGALFVSTSRSQTFGGVISGSGGLTKVGSGIVTLTGVNTYNGSTTVDGGTLQIPSGSLASNNSFYVGYSGSGSVAQSGGTNSVSPFGALTLGYSAGSSGTYSLSGGSLFAFYEELGESGSGSFTQSGGTNTNLASASGLTLGDNPGSSGTYNLTGSGLLSAPGETIGNSGSGSFTHSGGTNSVSGSVVLGIGSASSGTYNLSGSGLLSATNEYIGDSGSGSFTQSGGTNSVSATLTAATGYLDSSGTYILRGGSLSAQTEYLGFNYSGTGSFTQSGGTNSLGSLVLAESATSTGTYNLNGGLLSLSSVSRGQGSATFNFSGGTFQAASTFSTSVPIVLSTAGSNGLFDTEGNTLTLVGPLSGPGGFQKAGSGTLVLAVANGYTGTTLVSAGTLLLANVSALSGSTFDTSGTGSLSFGTLGGAAFGGLQGSGNLTLSNTANAAVSLSVGGNNAGTTFSGELSGSGSLTKIGTGTLTLGGNLALAGSVTVSGGTVNQSGGYLQAPTVIVDGGAYNLSGTGQLSAASLYVGYSGAGTFNQTGGTDTLTSALYLGTKPGSSGTYNLVGGLLIVPSVVQGSGSGSLNITGGILTGLTSGGTLSLPIILTTSGSSGTFDTPISSLTVAGQISGSGGLTKTGSATLVLAGDNTYSGNTTVAQGAVQLSNANAVQNSTVVLNVNSRLLFSGSIGAFNVGSIAGSGSLALSDTGGNAITLVTGGNNASTTYSGPVSGAGTLVKEGSGRLLLTNAITLTGPTDIQNGVFASANPFPGPITFSTPGGTLQAAGSAFAVSTNVLIDTGVTATIDTQQYSLLVTGAISGAGNLNKIGAGTLMLDASDSFTGSTTISQGTLQLVNSGALAISTLDTSGGGSLSFGTLNSVAFGGLQGSGSLTLTGIGGGPVTLAVGGNGANTTVSGDIGGNGTLVKDGTGMLALTGSNSFKGGLIDDPGVISVSSSAALGAPTGVGTWGNLKGNIIFANSGTLQADASFALSTDRSIVIAPGATATFDTQGYTLTIDGPISGNGSLTELGAGKLVLSGSSTYSGGTVVDAGILIIASPTALEVGTSLSVGGNATSVFASAAAAAPVAASPDAVAVPEPGTLALLAAGLLLAAFTACRPR